MSQSNKPSRRLGYLPIQSQDFIFTFRGREVRWMSRLLGTLFAPIMRWRQRRAYERGEDV